MNPTFEILFGNERISIVIDLNKFKFAVHIILRGKEKILQIYPYTKIGTKLDFLVYNTICNTAESRLNFNQIIQYADKYYFIVHSMLW